MDPKPVILLALCLGSPVQADFAAEDFPPYERFALCHGLFGVSAHSKFPNLAGQKPAYLTAQITAFLAGTRTNDGGQMTAIVTELTPDEIPVAVDWFQDQDPPEPTGTGDQRGGTLYAAGGCADCHDADGLDAAPYLTAQHAGYLIKQMTDFRDGQRSTDHLGISHEAMMPARDADIEAIAAYLAAQARP